MKQRLSSPRYTTGEMVAVTIAGMAVGLLIANVIAHIW